MVFKDLTKDVKYIEVRKYDDTGNLVCDINGVIQHKKVEVPKCYKRDFLTKNKCSFHNPKKAKCIKCKNKLGFTLK
jgi:hypothetical protein